MEEKYDVKTKIYLSIYPLNIMLRTLCTSLENDFEKDIFYTRILNHVNTINDHFLLMLR